MNLIHDPWLTFRFRDGQEKKLPLAAISNQDIIDFVVPRADFYGASYQFVIGLLQTIFAPQTLDDWLDHYEQPPLYETLQQAFTRVEHAFNVTGETPLFMQDFESLTEKPLSITQLLIDAPGENTLKKHNDHFIKHTMNQAMSIEMAALALFTLQINAPSGGQGHRTGLRGGGPLTTLIKAQDINASLWHKLWLNVISQEKFPYDEPDLFSASVFPWLEPTKKSNQTGTEVYQSQVHPLHMYWAMPRRIRLMIDNKQAICCLTEQPINQSVSQYQTKNNGYNYKGSWSHPLTPYHFNIKKPDEPRLSLKSQAITYNIWDNLTLTDTDHGHNIATVVTHYYQLCTELHRELTDTPQLWAFGFEMDNMKAKAWHNNSLPLFPLSTSQQNQFLLEVKKLQKLASDVLYECKKQIKSAWFSGDEKNNAKKDLSFIDLAFWQQTETIFYDIITQLATNPTTLTLTPSQAKEWLEAIFHHACNIFDRHVLSELANSKQLAKHIKARQQLQNWRYKKEVRAFKQAYQID